jgi:hypothetical protein
MIDNDNFSYFAGVWWIASFILLVPFSLEFLFAILVSFVFLMLR